MKQKFKTKREKTTAFSFFLVLSMLPSLAWPIVLYMCMWLLISFHQDAGLGAIIVLVLLSYPLFLLANAFLSCKLYDDYPKAAFALLLWPVAGTMYLCLEIASWLL